MPALDPLKNINPNEVLYQRRCANYVYVTPPGLKELMSDMSREVLRSHPVNICCFIADYLETLMVTREHARIAMKFVDGVAGQGVTVTNLLNSIKITRQQAEKAARIIQRAVRAYLLRRKKETGTVSVSVMQPKSEKFNQEEVLQKIIRRTKISEEQAERAVRVIQAAYRGYRRRMQESLDQPMIDWRAASHRTIEVFKSTSPTREEMHKAATLIKSAYKGFYTRRLIRLLLSKKTKINQLLAYSYDLGTLEKAATIIQRAVRVHIMKKKCRENPDDCPPQYIHIVSKHNLALKHSEGVVKELIEEALEVIKTTDLLNLNKPSELPVEEVVEEEEEKKEEAKEGEQAQEEEPAKEEEPVNEEEPANEEKEEEMAKIMAEEKPAGKPEEEEEELEILIA